MGSDLEFNPAAAQLDRETELELYALYRTYFDEAEDNRLWNVWNDIPWSEGADTEPSDELVNAVLACYAAELYIPEYLSVLLMHTRSSRARSWYVTRWSYEEGKHLLALGEWLTRRGTYTDENGTERGLFTNDELQVHGSDAVDAVRWEPPSIDAIALYVDAVLYEAQEIERYEKARELAMTGNDKALVTICDKILADETAQKAYFIEALKIIAKRHEEKVANAIEVVSATQPDSASAKDMLQTLVSN